jgi:multidrug efflux pump subunit AcrB
MKLLLFIVIVVLLVVAVVGFYRNWFQFSSHNDDGNPNITLSMDQDKIGTDMDKALDKAKDVGHKAVDKNSPSPEKAPR